MSAAPHDDQAQAIKAHRGRPPLPPMTDEEFEAVRGLLALPRGTHGSSLDRAALEVSLMRGAHKASDPRTRKTRTVSGRWVSRQLLARGIPGKNGMRAKFGVISNKHQVGRNTSHTVQTGTRAGYDSSPGPDQPFNNQQALLNEPLTPTPTTLQSKVDSERGGQE